MRLLIADDDANLRKVLAAELSDAGHDISVAENGLHALSLSETEDLDILLLDLSMPGLGGMDVLKKLKAFEAPPEVIILTGNATVPAAVEAMKLGAYDFITKPFRIEELKTVIDKAYEKRTLLRDNLRLRTQLHRQSAQNRIVTRSPLMLELLETAKRVSSSDFPVLIYGESGVGKELVAWAIHGASQRAEGPFVPINCGAIPEDIMESEFFGHERGAFTGAYARKMGLLEVADNGTVFFDEIGEIPQKLQVKLLRVIETRSFFRVGGVREIRVNVKFLAASNKDLKAESEKGNFRPDFYYRMSALTLHIPPLRERKEDIPLLVDHFIMNDPAFRSRKFGKEAIDVFLRYSWPGNVRELQNVVQRTLLLSENEVIGARDLPSDLIKGGTASGGRLDDVERHHILRVLREVDGHRGKAAEILGIDPKTLYRKLARYQK